MIEESLEDSLEESFEEGVEGLLKLGIAPNGADEGSGVHNCGLQEEVGRSGVDANHTTLHT